MVVLTPEQRAKKAMQHLKEAERQQTLIEDRIEFSKMLLPEAKAKGKSMHISSVELDRQSLLITELEAFTKMDQESEIAKAK